MTYCTQPLGTTLAWACQERGSFNPCAAGAAHTQFGNFSTVRSCVSEQEVEDLEGDPCPNSQTLERCSPWGALRLLPIGWYLHPHVGTALQLSSKDPLQNKRC